MEVWSLFCKFEVEVSLRKKAKICIVEPLFRHRITWALTPPTCKGHFKYKRSLDRGLCLSASQFRQSKFWSKHTSCSTTGHDLFMILTTKEWYHGPASHIKSVHNHMGEQLYKVGQSSLLHYFLHPKLPLQLHAIYAHNLTDDCPILTWHAIYAHNLTDDHPILTWKDWYPAYAIHMKLLHYLLKEQFCMVGVCRVPLLVGQNGEESYESHFPLSLLSPAQHWTTSWAQKHQ